MSKTISLFAVLILLLSACANDRASRYKTVNSNVSYGSVLELGFTDATERLVYGDANPDLQYGLLWLPRGLAATERVPLVVFIHGGCWLNEYDIQHSFALTTALAEAGYGVWSLEYRRSGDAGGGWPGSFEDIKRGVAFTSRLDKYPLDLHRIVVVGHSAGGHLALLAGTEFPGVDGVVGLAAITDIIEYSRGQNSCQTATIDFMGGKFEAEPAAYHAANPVEQPLHEQTILLHGDIDAIVPIGQAQVAGTTNKLVKGAGHFDWIHPGTEAHRLLLLTLEDVLQK